MPRPSSGLLNRLPYSFIFQETTQWKPKKFDRGVPRFEYSLASVGCLSRETFFHLFFPATIVTVAMGRDYVSVELGLLTGPLSIPKMTHNWISSSTAMILTGQNRISQR
jgi:hypothetical protein